MELIPDLFFFNQTQEGSICALGRFVRHFLLLSSVFQSVKENSKLLCRGPSLNITGWEGKFLEDLLPPKAEAGMVCLGKWCFYSKWNQVGSEGTAFQWWASHWNYVLHRHPQVYSQANGLAPTHFLFTTHSGFPNSPLHSDAFSSPKRPQEALISASLGSES